MGDELVSSRLDDLVLDLDLLVYSLERPAPEDAAAIHKERQRVRRELERARDTLREVLRSL